MPRRMKAAEFTAKCLEAVDRVARTGETLVVTERGKAVVRIVPAAHRIVRRPTTLRGLLKGLIEVRGDVLSPIDVKWNADS